MVRSYHLRILVDKYFKSTVQICGVRARVLDPCFGKLRLDAADLAYDGLGSGSDRAPAGHCAGGSARSDHWPTVQRRR
uniref:Uncharacterized protein n=1 Tax=Arundo donax TaxID=35708 RepID=A0A0A9HR31_ARUDO